MNDFSRFTERARKVVSDVALREALSLGHNYVGPEHLLLAAARDFLPEKDADTVRNLVLRQVGERCPTCGQRKPTKGRTST